MPLNKTRKVRERKKKILQLLDYFKEEMSTSDIADILDCSISQAYYALKELEREGLVEKKESRGGKPGKRYMWKIK